MHKIMNPDDVRMRQFEAALRLSFELIEHCMISNHQIGKKSQRDVAIQLFIVRQPDNSHSASPQDLDQRVTAKDFLSADRLTRRCCYDIARAFATQSESAYLIKAGRKV